MSSEDKELIARAREMPASATAGASEQKRGREARKEPRFKDIPTASGGIARAAYAHARSRLDIQPLLKSSGLTVRQLDEPRVRLPVSKQIRFVQLVADALQEEFLGVALAQDLELREIGLLYYVAASSDTLGDALGRIARYGRIQNEGVRITYSDREVSVTFHYEGIARLSDRHQIEFFVITLLRLARQLTGTRLGACSISLKHRRAGVPAKFKTVFGGEVIFGTSVDRIIYPRSASNLPLVHADPYLNALLVSYCEETLSRRLVRSSSWRLKLENAIAPLLPHGQANIKNVAERLGVTPRTLARRLASECLTFSSVLNDLRRDLAERYLREAELSISEVAWLLGYGEASAFTHAFKRWNGRTPKQGRKAASRVD